MRVNYYRIGSRPRVWTIGAAAIAALTAASISSALASCGSRPGTPSNVRTQANVGSVTLLWHDTTKRGEGSCHDIEIKGADGTDPALSVTGEVCLTGGTDGQYVSNVGFGTQYCYRIKARDHGGAEGCASAQWSARVCDAGLPPTGPAVGQISEFMPGIDLPGSDIAGAGGQILVPANPPFDLNGTAKICGGMCNQHPRCVAWTLVKPGVQGPEPVCYLKQVAPTLARNDCCVSGNKVLMNTDLPGMDISHFTFAAMNYMDCENKCAANNRCVTWTYVKPGVQGPGAQCYLKGSVPKAAANGCCTSGQLR